MIVPLIKASETPLRILNTELTFRLRCATKAIHKLRAQGYGIATQDLRLGGTGKPILYLTSGDEQLRQQCSQVAIEQHTRYRTITARFAGCDVRWEESGHFDYCVITVNGAAQ